MMKNSIRFTLLGLFLAICAWMGWEMIDRGNNELLWGYRPLAFFSGFVGNSDSTPRTSFGQRPRRLTVVGAVYPKWPYAWGRVPGYYSSTIPDVCWFCASADYRKRNQ